MSTVCVSACNLVLSHTIFSSESLLKTRRVESSERSKLIWLQARVDESCESCNVSRIEDNYDVLYVRTILLDVVTEVSSYLTVAHKEILTCHTILTRSTARRDDVLSTCESLFCIYGI